MYDKLIVCDVHLNLYLVYRLKTSYPQAMLHFFGLV